MLNGTLRMLGENGTISGYADCYDLINYTFELIEEQQNIDIQAIEDINIRPYKSFVDICNYIEEKGNEIIQAIKQLDRREER